MTLRGYDRLTAPRTNSGRVSHYSTTQTRLTPSSPTCEPPSPRVPFPHPHELCTPYVIGGESSTSASPTQTPAPRVLPYRLTGPVRDPESPVPRSQIDTHQQTKTTMASRRIRACALRWRPIIPRGLRGAARLGLGNQTEFSRSWPVLHFFYCGLHFPEGSVVPVRLSRFFFFFLLC